MFSSPEHGCEQDPGLLKERSNPEVWPVPQLIGMGACRRYDISNY